MNPIGFEHVYYVEKSRDEKRPFNPIAIRPKIKANEIEWEDTANGNHLKFQQISIEPEGAKGIPKIIRITTPEGKTVILRELTLQLFNEKVKQRAAAGNSRTFETDEALQRYYLQTDFRSPA